MHTPAELVSIVVPTRNYGAFIGSCIASILAQTYRDIELIVVDDCSTDDTAMLVDRLFSGAPKTVRRTELISLGTWRGKLGALNHALKYARGSHIVIFDADDVMVPQFVEKSLRGMECATALDPRVGFVYPDAVLIDEAGSAIGAGRAGPFCAERLLSHSYIPDCGLTVACAIQEVLPFDERIRVGTKHHKWKRIVDRGWVGAHLEEPLFQYRMHGRNISGIGARIRPDPVVGTELSKYWTR